MIKLLRYLKNYKKESFLAPLFKMLEASFELLIPIVMSHIIDIGIADKNLSYIGKMAVIMAVLGIIGLTCSITAQFFAAKAAVGFSKELRKDLFSHIQSLSYTEMDRVGNSTLITRMTSDINQVQNGVNMVLRLFLRSPFIVVGAMVMAFTINVKAAMVFVVTIPLLSLVVFSVMLLSIPLYKKVQERLDQVLKITRENLSGVRVIRAFHREEREKEQFQTSNQLLVKQQLFVGKISALMNPVTYIIINGAILVLIWIGAWQVEGGIITQGQVVALVNYMSQILVELVKLANLIILVTKAAACGNRIQAVFEVKSTMTEKKSSVEGSNREEAVIFDHVSLTYEKAGDTSLMDIDFSVKKGETIGIIGGTGSGKTSIVNLIPRFYDCTKGAVKVFGKNVKEYSFYDLRKKIGIVPQKAVLFRGTIRDNLRWGDREADDSAMWNALKATQAEEFVREKEGGLSFSIQQGGRNLSGGQKQRLTIARALVRKPEILILDDSASALDYATDAKLRQAISGLDPDMTVFIVSQRAASVWGADQILVLDDGRLAGKGTHDELLKNCQVYQEIYYSQFPKEGEADGR
ncbi:MAG: ABC transporter ATP-binding protein [Lachnospiraceae bacterium]|nr:ABC transporter ATP-binding protein [Lachnospiraceae bacterium]